MEKELRKQVEDFRNNMRVRIKNLKSHQTEYPEYSDNWIGIYEFMGEVCGLTEDILQFCNKVLGDDKECEK